MKRTLCALCFCLFVPIVYGQIGFLIPQFRPDNAFGRRSGFDLQSFFSADDGRRQGDERGHDRSARPLRDEVVFVREPGAGGDGRNTASAGVDGAKSLPVPIGNDDQVVVFSDSDEDRPKIEPPAEPGEAPHTGNEGNLSGNTSQRDEASTNPPGDENSDVNKDLSSNKEEVGTLSDRISDSVTFETPDDTKGRGPSSASTGLPELTPVPRTESRSAFGRGIFQETCTTAAGGLGSCIVLTACDDLYSKLRDRPSDSAVVSELRAAHCGFQGTDPKVCCPKAGFPETVPTEPPPQTSPSTDAPTTASSVTASLPDPPECGFSNASFSRVVGGVPAKLGDFPWMALLGYRPRHAGDEPRWLCGGSLVSRRHVLTAAHCIHKHENDLYIVRLGDLDISKDDDGATPLDVPIARAEKHESYNPTAFTDDIGLLLLQHDVQYTPLIQPICLPAEAELRARSFENYNPIVAGWGNTEFRGPSAPHLQALQLPVVSNEYCAEAYAAYKKQHIDERVLCAGYRRGGRDACQGDSGGPLMQPIWSQQTFKTYFYQIGVVSFGKNCAEAGYPGVYTRITHYVPWLQRKITGEAAA